MKVTISHSDLLARARLILGFDHTRADGLSVQGTGTNVDTLLGRALRAWYLDLLDRGERRHLWPVSVRDLLVSADSEPAASTTVAHGSDCRRLLSVRLPGWKQAAEPLPATALAETVQHQLNPYTAATPAMPVAVLLPSGRGAVCWPAASTSGPGIISATGVLDSDPETYVFEESAFETLPSFLKKHFGY